VKVSPMDKKLIAEHDSRCSTGVEGLDEILYGGLPRHRLYLIQGNPGVGKTTLGLQFLLEGARLGEIGLYVTLSETKDELQEVARSHQWNLNPIELLELSSLQLQRSQDAANTFFHPSEVELEITTSAITDCVEKINPVRLVFDSLSEVRLLAETPLRYRREILQLKQFLVGRGCTVLFLDEWLSGASDLNIESIAHGIINLRRTSPDYGISRRQLSVEKLRGAKFREGNHDFVIRTGGMVVFPRLVASEHYSSFQPEPFSSGVDGIDAILGGGLDRGTSNMFMGPPGTGKSTLAMKYALAAASRGEKVLFFTFDESLATITARASQLRMDITPHVTSGRILISKVDPAELPPGELVCRISRGVLHDGVRMVIIDSINGYLNAMPAESYLNLQLHELLAFLNHQGVLTIIVLAQQGLIGSIQTIVKLTYLADTVVMFRYFEASGAVKQALSIIKKRSGNHERTVRELKVGEAGIEVGPPLSNLQGVLTGMPTPVALST
jgi:circadian clock protein KaiC